MRTIDVLRKWCGITDGPTLEKEVIRFETAILEAAEALGRETGESGIQVLPGVAKLLADLGSEVDKRDGEEKWAICTSCKYCITVYMRKRLTISHAFLRWKSHPHCWSPYPQSLCYCRLCYSRKALP
jgi:hypothetical protein